MKIFTFVKKQDKDRITDCGLKTSEYGSVKAVINKTERDCIRAYFTPDDDSEADRETCEPVKIDVNPEETVVAEGTFRKTGSSEMYEDSFVKLSDYKLGTYRMPECLVYETVLPDTVSRFNPSMDEPLLYRLSEELYVDSLFAKAEDETDDFKEKALKALFESDAECKKKAVGNCIVYEKDGKTVFISRNK